LLTKPIVHPPKSRNTRAKKKPGVIETLVRKQTEEQEMLRQKMLPEVLAHEKEMEHLRSVNAAITSCMQALASSPSPSTDCDDIAPALQDTLASKSSSALPPPATPQTVNTSFKLKPFTATEIGLDLITSAVVESVEGRKRVYCMPFFSKVSTHIMEMNSYELYFLITSLLFVVHVQEDIEKLTSLFELPHRPYYPIRFRAKKYLEALFTPGAFVDFELAVLYLDILVRDTQPEVVSLIPWDLVCTGISSDVPANKVMDELFGPNIDYCQGYLGCCPKEWVTATFSSLYPSAFSITVFAAFLYPGFIHTDHSSTFTITSCALAL